MASVSVGLPTYNGARYIREALDSLLAQDHRDLEILVSDNASTDDTWDIVQGYAARDERVRAIRQEVNIGAPANFNFVFRQTSSPFFMWAADDDRWEPGYVTACLRGLAEAPAAVLACTRIRFIDEAGRPRDAVPVLFDNPDLSSPSVGRRVDSIMSRASWYTIYGLMRREALASTRLYREGFGADVVLLLELALAGPFVRVSLALHETRLFDTRSEDDRGAWHNSIPNRDLVKAAPFTHLQEGFSVAIAAAPVGLRAKVAAWLAMMFAIYLRPTPFHLLVIGEIETRLRAAVRARDIWTASKYLSIKAAMALYRRRPFRRGVPLFR